MYSFKLALRQGDWREAEQRYTSLQSKDFPVHKSLRAELLRQKALDNLSPMRIARHHRRTGSQVPYQRQTRWKKKEPEGSAVCRAITKFLK